MTLCTVWIRQVNGNEELVFATDSCLTGGEKWKHGIKLFDLPRKDCLLCFAGSTMRAYPLVLNLISSISLDKYLESPSSSLEDTLNFLSDLFTKLVKTIISEIKEEDIHQLRSDASFLFGGWDWRKGPNGAFRVWKLYYRKEVEGFIFDELTNDDTKNRFYYFMGNASIDIVAEAKERFKKMLFEQDLQDTKLDMEPIKILRDLSLDSDIREVDGSLQVAKVLKSSRTEFFGIYWPSVKGHPFFQGREYHEKSKPLVRYFDPDTFEFFESDLPPKLTNISEELYGSDLEFVKNCYPEPDGSLRDDLAEKDKYYLRLIFKEVAYRQFLKNMGKVDSEGINLQE